MGTIKSIKDLKVYLLSYQLAMEIYFLTKTFPKDEQYSLTDQIRRSSRSVPANIREGYAKRHYENVFVRHLIDSLGSSEETRTWLEFSRDCSYLSTDQFEQLNIKYDEVSAMLTSLIKKWHTY